MAHLLVVDDEPSARTTLALLLRRRGHRVAEAEDVAGATKRLSEEVFDLVVTDLRMPDGDGLDVLQAARAQADAPEVILLTAYAEWKSAKEAIRLGAKDYLPKPADVDDILAALQRGPDDKKVMPADFQAPSLARTEWEHIHRVLTDCEGNVSEAARRLGIHRRSLQRKLQRYPPRE